MGLRTVAGIAACIMGVAVSIQSEAQTSRDGTAVHGCYFDSHEHLSLQDYDSIIVAYPKCAKAFFGRGNKYMLDSRYDEALKDYSEAIRLDPLYTDAFYNRALVYGIEKKFSLAFPDLDEVLRKNPNDAAALSWRMVDRMALGDQAKGDADASRLSAMNPNAQPSNCRYVGNAYMQCARPDGSTYTYRLNVPYYPSGTDSCFKNLAGTYFCQRHD